MTLMISAPAGSITVETDEIDGTVAHLDVTPYAELLLTAGASAPPVPNTYSEIGRILLANEVSVLEDGTALAGDVVLTRLAAGLATVLREFLVRRPVTPTSPPEDT